MARKREELANKTLSPGQNIEEFFDKMQEIFQEVDPLMSEEATVADIRRAIRAVLIYYKQLAVTDFKKVSEMQATLYQLNEAEKVCPAVESNFLKQRESAESSTVQSRCRRSPDWDWRHRGNSRGREENRYKDQSRSRLCASRFQRIWSET